jgi:hypothetical protein
VSDAQERPTDFVARTLQRFEQKRPAIAQEFAGLGVLPWDRGSCMSGKHLSAGKTLSWISATKTEG